MQQTRKVLITGGKGRLGESIRDRLSNNNFQTYVATRDPKNETETLYDPYCISEFIINKNIDTIVHLSTCYGRNNECTKEVFQTNVEIPLRILTKLEQKSYKVKFIVADTFYHYQDKLNLEFKAYSQTKRIFEKRVIKLNPIHNMRFIKIKNVVGGKSQRPTFIEDTLNKIIFEKKMVEISRPNQIRDFIHIDDVTTYFEQIIKNNSNDRITFNCAGTGQMQSVGEFLASILQKYTEITGDQSINKLLRLRSTSSFNNYDDIHYTPTNTLEFDTKPEYLGSQLHEKILSDLGAI